MEFPRQVYWSGLPFPPPGDLPGPEIEPASLASLLHCRQILHCCAKILSVDSYNLNKQKLNNIILGENKEEEKEEKEGGGRGRLVVGSKG